MPLITRQWWARTLLLLAAFAHGVTALRFTEDEWDLKPGKPLNISWHDTTQDVNIGIYLARKVPGRAELQLNLNLTAEDQKNGFVVFDVPNTFVNGLYQFNLWGDGADYRLQVIGDASPIFSDGGLSTGAKAGIVIGVLLIVGAILFAVLFVLRRRGIINRSDGHTALAEPEPDAFLQRAKSRSPTSSPKPPRETHHAAEVSGDYTYRETGGATGVEMNNFPSAAQAATSYSQPHNTPSLPRSHSRSDVQEYDQYDYDRRTSNRHSQAVSSMSEPPEYGRSPPQRYSMAVSQPDVQEYPRSPSVPQIKLPSYGHGYQSPTGSDTQAYGRSRRESDTENLIMPPIPDDPPHNRQSYQDASFETWPRASRQS